MRVLVTGGAGFIGSAFCRAAIIAKGWDIAVVDKLTYAASQESLQAIQKHAAFRFFKEDICDFRAMRAIVAEYQPDAIIHLAAESHVDRSIESSAPFITTNIVGTHTLLEVAREYWNALPKARKDTFRFLHVSTDEVYGSLAEGAFFYETTAYDPRSPYSASKASSDHLARAWQHTYGLPTLVTNCSNNYGPYQFPEKLIPLIVLNALEMRPLPVYGDGGQERDWLFVDDHVRALTLALEKGEVGETYNIGGRAPKKNLAVVETICDILDRRHPAERRRRSLISFVQDRPGHDRRYAIDPSKIESKLGWRAEETFDSGLERTIDWYLANEAWWRPLRKNVYQGERIGLLGQKA